MKNNVSIKINKQLIKILPYIISRCIKIAVPQNVLQHNRIKLSDFPEKLPLAKPILGELTAHQLKALVVVAVYSSPLVYTATSKSLAQVRRATRCILYTHTHTRIYTCARLTSSLDRACASAALGSPGEDRVS